MRLSLLNKKKLVPVGNAVEFDILAVITPVTVAPDAFACIFTSLPFLIDDASIPVKFQPSP